MFCLLLVLLYVLLCRQYVYRMNGMRSPHFSVCTPRNDAWRDKLFVTQEVACDVWSFCWRRKMFGLYTNKHSLTRLLPVSEKSFFGRYDEFEQWRWLPVCVCVCVWCTSVCMCARIGLKRVCAEFKFVWVGNFMHSGCSPSSNVSSWSFS